MATLYNYCKEKNKEYLLQEWDYELNKEFDIKTILTGSNKKVWWKCTKCNGVWQTSIYDRTRKQSTGCPYCANQKVLKGYNDLATKYPDAIKQWHPTKNGNLKPSDVMAGSSRKVWWICSNGHEFEQKINARIKHLYSCPYCSGQKVLIGYNDLASQYPNIAKEWNYEKNGNITPRDITWGSNKKFWWKCSTCGHEWNVRVAGRTRENTGCPVCANKTLAKGINDLATKFPEIAKEWHPTKNELLTPDNILATSLKKVWWQCAKGHDFLQSVNLRTTRNQGCPICNNQKILIDYNDLATTHSEIAKEWHSTKNGNLTPRDVVAGSTKKVWWICSNGHEYEQAIEKRTARNQSCPYCSGHKVLQGFNDFQTKFPEIAKEWHPTKNGNLKPSEVTYGSGKKVWWKCPIGHEYQAIVRDRGVGQTNCPICNTRNSTSFSEQAILYYVKQLCPDAINKFKDIFKTSMELDIYIPTLKIAIEYDGAVWHKNEEHYKREVKKYKACKEAGIHLIRVKEQNNLNWVDVADEIYYLPKVKRYNLDVLERVITKILKRLNSKEEINIDIDRDKYQILEYLYKIDNSLAEKRPDVAAKWNYEKNGYLEPNMFSVGSNEIVWWKCPDCGNEWETSINHMTRKGTYGCPICANIQSGKTFTKGVVARVGSFAETMPELAKEWHPTKNGDLTPNDITAGRSKPVWWLCKKCGYEWKASPNIRKRGIGCPCCSGRVPKIGVNDLETLYPQIAKEWNYRKNDELKPNMFKSGSGKKVWWICPECNNEYEATIAHRTAKIKPTGCPICGHKKGAKSCSFSVNMFDINTNELLRTFNSVTEASKTMHICYENISKTCKGERQEAGGYKWSYAK